MKSYTNLLARDVLGAKTVISANPNNPNMIIILPLFDSGLFLFYSQKDRWKMKNIGLGSELVKSEKSNTKYINLVDGIYTDTYINDGSNIYSLNNTSFKDNHLYLDGCLIDIISENDIIEELRYQDSNGIRFIKFEYNNDYINKVSYIDEYQNMKELFIDISVKEVSIRDNDNNGEIYKLSLLDNNQFGVTEIAKANGDSLVTIEYYIGENKSIIKSDGIEIIANYGKKNTSNGIVYFHSYDTYNDGTTLSYLEQDEAYVTTKEVVSTPFVRKARINDTSINKMDSDFTIEGGIGYLGGETSSSKVEGISINTFDMFGLQLVYDISPKNKALCMTIPLVNAQGNIPLSLSLVYDYKDRNRDYGFGLGYKLSLYKKFKLSDNKLTLTITDAYGIEEIFYAGAGYYYSIKSKTKIKISNQCYELTNDDITIVYNADEYITDVYGNEVLCNEYFYPTKIKNTSGKSIILSIDKIRTDYICTNGSGSVVSKYAYKQIVTIEDEYYKITFTRENDNLKCLYQFDDNNREMVDVLQYTHSASYVYTSFNYNDDNSKVIETVCNSLYVENLDSRILVNNSIDRLSYSIYFVSNRIDSINKYYLIYDEDGESEADDCIYRFEYNKSNTIIYNKYNDKKNYMFDYNNNVSNIIYQNKNDVILDVEAIGINDNCAIVNQATLPTDLFKNYTSLSEHSSTFGWSTNLSFTRQISYTEDTPILLWGYIDCDYAEVEINDNNYSVNGISGEKRLFILGYEIKKTTRTINITLKNCINFKGISDIRIEVGASYSRYSYDGLGNLIFSDENSLIKEYTYNSKGNITSVSINGKKAYENEYKEDLNTIVKRTNLLTGLVEENSYDNNNSLTKKINKCGDIYTQEVYSYENGGLVAKSVYSYRDYISNEYSPNGVQRNKKQYYNNGYSLGLISVDEFHVLKPNETSLIKYDYYDKSLKNTVEYFEGPYQNSRQFGGSIAKATQGDVTYHNYFYENDYNYGMLESVKMNDTTIESFEYTIDNNLSKKTYSDGSFESYSYSNGLLKSVSYNGKATQRLYYDENDRLTDNSDYKIEYAYNNVKSVNIDNNKIKYFYDNYSNPISIMYENGNNVIYDIIDNRRDYNGLVKETVHMITNSKEAIYIPLLYNLYTVKGIKPASCNIESVNFDDGLFMRGPSALAYSFESNDKFKFDISIKPISCNDSTTLVEFNGASKSIKLILDGTKLLLSVDNQTYDTYIQVVYGKYNNISITCAIKNSKASIWVKGDTCYTNIFAFRSRRFFDRVDILLENKSFSGYIKDIFIDGGADSSTYTVTKKKDIYSGLGVKTGEEIYRNDQLIYQNNYQFQFQYSGNNEKCINSRITSEKIEIGDNKVIKKDYKYDGLGILNSIYCNDVAEVTYSFDGLGRITKENSNSIVYDSNNNIKYNNGKKYEYSNGKLVKYGTEVISYENNSLYPNEYLGKRLKFSCGRLNSINTNINYEYLFNGLRKKKTVDNKETKFYYEGNKLIREEAEGYSVDYLYSNDILFGFIYKNSTYFYVRDMLQNIIGVIDSSGKIVVEYKYDAFGVPSTTTRSVIADINHFMYKGYYYDTESGFYYLKSRYYDPVVGRFISPDSIDYINPQDVYGMNLFTYCNNNPVMYSDGDGHFAILTALLIGAGILVSGAITGLGAALGREYDESFWGAFAGGFIDGAVGSIAVAVTAAIPGAGGIIAGGIIAFAGGFAGNFVGQFISYGFNNIDYKASALQGGISAFVNVFTGGVLRMSGTVTGVSKLARFIDASKISALGVAITGYLTYYSFPSANRIRKKETDIIYEI